MFTGIIEATGVVKEVITNGSNQSFWISSPLGTELKIDQSLSHNGVCLTVEEIRSDLHRVTAIDETLQITTLDNWKIGQLVNLERSLKIGDRLDGHMVQGHVDATATCRKIKEKKGSVELRFDLSKKHNGLLIEKGAVCIDGISLTAFDVGKKSFTVAIIPYTLQHTNLQNLKPGMEVNIEFDMIGKYLNRRF